MLLIWQGLGLLVAVIPLVMFFLIGSIDNALHLNTEAVMALIGLASAAAIFYLGV
jgi:hypothetical protein